MGLLDDLKKQAEQVKSQQLSQESLRGENLRLVEEKMRQTFQYLNELLKQLAVLKPVNPVVYALPGIGDLKNLSYAESFVDYRTKRINDRDYLDSVLFFIRWGSGETFVVERDMPETAQKVRSALIGLRLQFQEDEVRGQRGTAPIWRFTARSAIVTDVTIEADYEQGRLLVTGKNLERFGTETFAVPAHDVNEALLEQLAKTLLGQPGGFRKYRAVFAPR